MELKRVLPLILFTVIGTHCVAQKSDRDKIYWTALEQYVISIDSTHAKYPQIYPLVNEIYLEQTNYVDSIPPQIKGHKIVLINWANQRKLYDVHNNKLVHTKMFPLSIENEKLSITITPYRGVFKKNKYNLGVSDGTTIYFKFDCEAQKYIVDKVENWGI